MARSRARARLNWVSQGQRWGRCRVRRRAERVIRPAREKNAAGGSWWSPPAHPDRSALSNGPGYASPVSGQAARLWFSPTPYFRSRMAFSTSALVGLQLQGFPVPVGDEAVIAVGGEEGQLGTGSGLHPPDNEAPVRRRAHSGRGCRWSRPPAAPSIQYGMGVQSASGMARSGSAGFCAGGW